jgi:hypothetical protein
MKSLIIILILLCAYAISNQRKVWEYVVKDSANHPFFEIVYKGHYYIGYNYKGSGLVHAEHCPCKLLH